MLKIIVAFFVGSSVVLPPSRSQLFFVQSQPPSLKNLFLMSGPVPRTWKDVSATAAVCVLLYVELWIFVDAHVRFRASLATGGRQELQGHRPQVGRGVARGVLRSVVW